MVLCDGVWCPVLSFLLFFFFYFFFHIYLSFFLSCFHLTPTFSLCKEILDGDGVGGSGSWVDFDGVFSFYLFFLSSISRLPFVCMHACMYVCMYVCYIHPELRTEG